MTVSTIYQPATHTGDDTTGPWAFNWEVANDSIVLLFLDDVQQDAADYNVTFTGSAPLYTGGNVDTVAPVPAGVAIRIERLSPANQKIDFDAYKSFPAEINEFGLDKLSLAVQELAHRVNQLENP